MSGSTGFSKITVISRLLIDLISGVLEKVSTAERPENNKRRPNRGLLPMFSPFSANSSMIYYEE